MGELAGRAPTPPTRPSRPAGAAPRGGPRRARRRPGGGPRPAPGAPPPTTASRPGRTITCGRRRSGGARGPRGWNPRARHPPAPSRAPTAITSTAATSRRREVGDAAHRVAAARGAPDRRQRRGSEPPRCPWGGGDRDGGHGLSPLVPGASGRWSCVVVRPAPGEQNHGGVTLIPATPPTRRPFVTAPVRPQSRTPVRIDRTNARSGQGEISNRCLARTHDRGTVRRHDRSDPPPAPGPRVRRRRGRATAATRRASGRSARRSACRRAPPSTRTSRRCRTRATSPATPPSPARSRSTTTPSRAPPSSAGPCATCPLVGDVAAGTGVLAVENVEETLPDPGGLHRRRRALHAPGARRLDDRRRHPRRRLRRRAPAADAEPGDTVVAGIPGEEATVKTFLRRRNKIVLRPENADARARWSSTPPRSRSTARSSRSSAASEPRGPRERRTGLTLSSRHLVHSSHVPHRDRGPPRPGVDPRRCATTTTSGCCVPTRVDPGTGYRWYGRGGDGTPAPDPGVARSRCVARRDRRASSTRTSHPSSSAGSCSCGGPRRTSASPPSNSAWRGSRHASTQLEGDSHARATTSASSDLDRRAPGGGRARDADRGIDGRREITPPRTHVPAAARTSLVAHGVEPDGRVVRASTTSSTATGGRARHGRRSPSPSDVTVIDDDGVAHGRPPSRRVRRHRRRARCAGGGVLATGSRHCERWARRPRARRCRRRTVRSISTATAHGDSWVTELQAVLAPG